MVTLRMIVCVCNAISEQEIKDWVELGGSSMSELSDDLGLGTYCGSCRDCARQIVTDSVQARLPDAIHQLQDEAEPTPKLSGFVAVARAVGP